MYGFGLLLLFIYSYFICLTNVFQQTKLSFNIRMIIRYEIYQYIYFELNFYFVTKAFIKTTYYERGDHLYKYINYSSDYDIFT